MATITLGGKIYERHDLTPVEEAFYNNFLCRRLVETYGVPLSAIAENHLQHVLHDLNAVRYRAWLVLRAAGVTLEAIGELVTDETAIDVFTALWTTPLTVYHGDVRDLINEKRKAKGLLPIGGRGDRDEAAD